MERIVVYYNSVGFAKIYRILQIADITGREKPNFFSNVDKSVVSSTEKAPESGKTIVDLKNIESILLRDENLNSSKIQNSSPYICSEHLNKTFFRAR